MRSASLKAKATTNSGDSLMQLKRTGVEPAGSIMNKFLFVGVLLVGLVADKQSTAQQPNRLGAAPKKNTKPVTTSRTATIGNDIVQVID